jgi:hypothetical protein
MAMENVLMPHSFIAGFLRTQLAIFRATALDSENIHYFAVSRNSTLCSRIFFF